MPEPESKTILIVDDEAEIRENLCDFAEFKGFAVLQASNGREALERMENDKPHLVVSDLKMPEMDGLQMLEEMRRRNLNVPVVIMTAFGTMEYAVKAMKSGAADFITKPIDLPYLLEVAGRVLRRSEIAHKVQEQQRQLDEDLQHAANIQRCLLPDPIDTGSLSMRYRYQPLIQIGGDYLTVHQYNDKRAAVALYDVTGHGVAGALTAILVHNQLQQRLAEYRPPSNVMDLLNRFFMRNIGKTSMFVTMVIAMIDLEDERVTICNAGHPDVFYWSESEGELKNIPSHTMPVGFRDKILGDHNETTFEAAPGDRLFLYTDGFIETVTQEQKPLGISGLKTMIEACREQPADALIETLFRQLDQARAGDADDDLTLVVVDIKPS